MRRALGITTFALACGLAPPAAAQALVPGPGEAGFDAALASKAGDFERQIHAIMTPSVGWGLEAFVGDSSDRALIDGFIASGSTDFEAQAGQHVYSVVDRYGEHGDLGMFGGVQAAGDAFRYAVLRDSGADAAEVDRARQHVIAAMDGLHWYTRVTGTPGVFARGIRRITPEAGEPPLPGTLPQTVPLFDAGGNPQPADKEPTWRDDLSGELPFLIWLDDSSKDQFIGYVLALGAVYDVVAQDSTIPQDKIDRLVADTRAIAQELMKKRTIGTKEIDLVIMDADGRPTSFHDLSAEELTPGLVLDNPANAFNAIMSLGAMRTFFHITGDEDIGRYYYEELIEARGYLDLAADDLGIIYMGNTTNFSNINMAFVAIYGVLRYETDPDVAAQVRVALESQLYAAGKAREAKGLKQSLFDFIYAGFRDGGTGGPGQTAVADGLETLSEYPPAPHWNDPVTNCDDTELMSLDCTGTDGTPLPVSPNPGRNDSTVGTGPTPMRLRPPSNFEWRSDPHRLNGGGGDRLNPGGGFHCAYWLGRFLQSSSNGLSNVSTLARPRPSSGSGGAGGASGAGGGAGTTGTGGAGGSGGSQSGTSDGDSDDDGGCGCRVAGRSKERSSAALLALAAWVAARRRRVSACSERRLR